MLISRREFLKKSAVVVPAAAIMPTVFQRAVSASIKEQSSNPAPLGDRTLVIVQMAGGNDGLNTIVPANDSRYYELRPELTVLEADLIPMDSQRGFHPVLGPFKELWEEGRLALVEGVGYPDPTFSHFEAMDIWQTADLKVGMFEGWLGRYLEGIASTQEGGFSALSVGRKLPRALFTHKVSVPMLASVEEYRFQADPRHPANLAARTKTLASLFASSPDATPFGALLDNTLQAAQRSSDAMQDAKAAYTSAIEYPDSRLGRGLQILAQAITADLGIRVGHVSIGGFDTHASQIPAHDELLADVAGSIYSFYRDLQAQGWDKNVVIMTWSEFGRRVTTNASGGTDHGSAGPMFLVGTPVEGGLYGEPSSLADLDRDNLKFTTDFRSVYATVLEGWLGAPAELVLGARFEQLPFIAKEAVVA